MSTRRKELLLAAIHRSGRALTSGEAVDIAHGLAIAEGWPIEQLEELNRKSASSLLQSMVISHVLMYAGDTREEGQSRSVPTYAPMGAYCDTQPIPEAPAIERMPRRAATFDCSKKQLLDIIEEQTLVLDAQAELLETVQRFQSDWRTRTESLRRKIGPLKAAES